MVDADGRLLGILDRADLLHAAWGELGALPRADAGDPDDEDDEVVPR